MPRRRRRPLRRLGLLLSTPVGAILLVGAITGGAGSCLAVGGVGGTADTPSKTALAQIPRQLLPIFEQVAAQYHIPWEVLAGIANNECSLGNSSDPSCTLQPGATGPGAANYAGASGLMQIGVGGAAGAEYQSLRHDLPNPQLGPHDPTTAVQLAALVLTKDKGAPPGRPIPAYLPYVTAYNGSGPSAIAYGQRVIADAHSYQGNGTTAVSSSGSSSYAAGQCAAAASQFVAGNGLDPIPGFRPGRDDMGVDGCASPGMPIIAPAQSTLVEVVQNWYAGQPLMLLKLNPPLAGTLDGDQYWFVAEQITPVTERTAAYFKRGRSSRDSPPRALASRSAGARPHPMRAHSRTSPTPPPPTRQPARRRTGEKRSSSTSTSRGSVNRHDPSPRSSQPYLGNGGDPA